MAHDDRATPGWCQHVGYDDLVADPVGTVSALYAQVGEEVTDLHARRMRAWLEDRPQDAFGHHRYDPADFGWTYAGLAEEFRPYADRYLTG
jgi:hypothetical protein